MEIPKDVWIWLVKLKAVASVRASKQASANDVVRVDQQAQAEIESYVLLCLFFFLLDNLA